MMLTIIHSVIDDNNGDTYNDYDKNENYGDDLWFSFIVSSPAFLHPLPVLIKRRQLLKRRCHDLHLSMSSIPGTPMPHCSTHVSSHIRNSLSSEQIYPFNIIGVLQQEVNLGVDENIDIVFGKEI